MLTRGGMTNWVLELFNYKPWEMKIWVMKFQLEFDIMNQFDLPAFQINHQLIVNALAISGEEDEAGSARIDSGHVHFWVTNLSSRLTLNHLLLKKLNLSMNWLYIFVILLLSIYTIS